eukprot:366414-Chlamydomonas_euryale.AAC.4
MAKTLGALITENSMAALRNPAGTDDDDGFIVDLDEPAHAHGYNGGGAGGPIGGDSGRGQPWWAPAGFSAAKALLKRCVQHASCTAHYASHTSLPSTTCHPLSLFLSLLPPCPHAAFFCPSFRCATLFLPTPLERPHFHLLGGSVPPLAAHSSSFRPSPFSTTHSRVSWQHAFVESPF